MIRDIHALTEDEKKFASVEIKDHTQSSVNFEDTEQDSIKSPIFNMRVKTQTFSKLRGEEIQVASELSPGAQYFQKQRFEIRAKNILEDAWLVCQ